jgi:periplasmic divalent cation tolerance protein
VYRWQGATRTEREWQILFKTTTARYDDLETYLKGAHTYDTPEIIATPIVTGSAAYLAWLEEETRPGE